MIQPDINLVNMDISILNTLYLANSEFILTINSFGLLRNT